MAKYILSTFCENMKHMIVHKPPLTLFLLTLGLSAIVLLSLGYYIRANDIPSQNIAENWNIFLQSISDLEFCLVNKSLPAKNRNSEIIVTNYLPKKMTDSVDVETYDQFLNNSDIKNVSVALLVTIHPTQEFVNSLQNASLLSGFLHTKDLGISSEDLIGISIYLPSDWNSSTCDNSFHSKCNPINFYTCVYLSALPHLFPSSKGPSSCRLLDSTNIFTPTKINIISHKNKFNQKFRCQSKTSVKIQHKMDHQLNIMLSIEDRSLINLHLMHTSFFLLVTVGTIFIYSLVKNSFKMIKAHPQNNGGV